jgi:uncharacterized protein (DUF1697 family)
MRYIALLRAVNVGKRQMKMDILREALEDLKLRNVETFIASGNALFDSTASAAALEARIEKQLEKVFGFDVPTMIRSAVEMSAVANYKPFPKYPPPPAKTGALYVGFLKDDPTPAGVAKVLEFNDAKTEFHVHGREVYWYIRDKPTMLKISGRPFDRALGVPATFRNVTVVRKLAEKCPT